MRALRKIQRLPDPAVSLDVYLKKLQAWQMDGKLGQLTDNGREMCVNEARIQSRILADPKSMYSRHQGISIWSSLR